MREKAASAEKTEKEEKNKKTNIMNTGQEDFFRNIFVEFDNSLIRLFFLFTQENQPTRLWLVTTGSRYNYSKLKNKKGNKLSTPLFKIKWKH